MAPRIVNRGKTELLSVYIDESSKIELVKHSGQAPAYAVTGFRQTLVFEQRKGMACGRDKLRGKSHIAVGQTHGFRNTGKGCHQGGAHDQVRACEDLR